MDVLCNKLQQIKANPQAYLKWKSLDLLRAYFAGYYISNPSNDTQHNTLSSDFSDFVLDIYPVSESLSYLQAIIYYNPVSEEAAFDKYFELIDEFMLTYKPKVENSKEKEKNKTKKINKNCAVRVRHYTNHGNPEHFTNPHDHIINWETDGTFMYGPAINNVEEELHLL